MSRQATSLLRTTALLLAATATAFAAETSRRESFAERFGLDCLEPAEPSPATSTAEMRREMAEGWLFGTHLEEEDILDQLIFRPAPRLVIRPTGSPWFLPRELGSDEFGDKPGPGVGLRMSWRPSAHWRFGTDLLVRAERVDADNRLHDWTGYVAPGIEYIPVPHAERPFAIGVVVPGALRRFAGEKWGGVFLVIRWMDQGARKPRGVRGNDE